MTNGQRPCQKCEANEPLKMVFGVLNKVIVKILFVMSLLVKVLSLWVHYSSSSHFAADFFALLRLRRWFRLGGLLVYRRRVV